MFWEGQWLRLTHSLDKWQKKLQKVYTQGMWVSLRICTVNIILSVWFFTDMLYLCLSLYFPPTQSVSSEDSPWWLLNRDDKQLKKHILIGCGNDKTLTKHERFMYSEEKPRLPLNKRYFLLSSKTCIELDTHSFMPWFLFSVDPCVTPRHGYTCTPR